MKWEGRKWGKRREDAAGMSQSGAVGEREPSASWRCCCGHSGEDSRGQRASCPQMDQEALAVTQPGPGQSSVAEETGRAEAKCMSQSRRRSDSLNTAHSVEQ